MVLNDHTNFTESNALDCMPDLLENRIGGGIDG